MLLPASRACPGRTASAQRRMQWYSGHTCHRHLAQPLSPPSPVTWMHLIMAVPARPGARGQARPVPRDSDGSDLPCCGLLVGQALLGPGDSDGDSDASERAEEALDTIRDPIPHQNVSGQSALYSTYSHTVEAKVSLFGAGVVPSGGKGLQEGAATRRPTAIRRGSMAST